MQNQGQEQDKKTIQNKQIKTPYGSDQLLALKSSHPILD